MSAHTGSNKLKGFGPVYVINLEEREDRRNYIENALKNAGVKKYKLTKAINGNSPEVNDLIHGKEKIPLSNPEIGASISHLQTIKQWLEESNSDYAIIIEDDLSFETVEFWDFNFEEFLSSINKEYDILQFCIIHNYRINRKFHMKEKQDWSAACYLIKREWAQKLIDKHYVDGKIALYPNRESLADSLIYREAKAYSIPLFTFTLEFESSINQQHQNGSHKRSREQTTDYWKNKNIK